ncbi:MAG: DSD1 family PLP-dependent enzyme [Rhodospirillaceae bacterium]
MNLFDLETPALVLDEPRMLRNIERMRSHLASLGVAFRPHLKTCKSIDVARHMMTAPNGPATVSTLKEAEYFFDHGVSDLLYAVGIAPNKLPHVLALQARGARLRIILDNVDAARAVGMASRDAGQPLEALIEIDSDGHRSGVHPDDPLLLDVARELEAGGARLAGVMTHAGSSYSCTTVEAIRAMAEQERDAAVHCAMRLREAGYECPVVSVGSTPTATFARDLTGVTEVRTGVFVFFDLFMAGIRVCTTDDIALSVLTSVIGHQREKGWAIVDAGWMAMSRDRGTARQAVDQGYGLVCDMHGRLVPDLVMIDANQEHGIVAHRSGDPARLPDLPVGTLLRVLPNHACATGAQHDRYHIVREDTRVHAIWPRFSGW